MSCIRWICSSVICSGNSYFFTTQPTFCPNLIYWVPRFGGSNRQNIVHAQFLVILVQSGQFQINFWYIFSLAFIQQNFTQQFTLVIAWLHCSKTKYKLFPFLVTSPAWYHPNPTLPTWPGQIRLRNDPVNSDPNPSIPFSFNSSANTKKSSKSSSPKCCKNCFLLCLL